MPDRRDRPISASQSVPLAEKQAHVDDVFHKVARPLRPDERPDVGGPAPALEGRARHAPEPPRRPAFPPSRRRRRHRRRRLPHPRCRRAADPTSPCSTSMATCSRSGASAPASATTGRIDFVEAMPRRCRSDRSILRRLHDRLRHPQRAADRGGARRGPSRAEARRALPVPRILARSTCRGSTRSTTPIRSTSSRASAGGRRRRGTLPLSGRIDPPLSDRGAFARHDRGGRLPARDATGRDRRRRRHPFRLEALRCVG